MYRRCRKDFVRWTGLIYNEKNPVCLLNGTIHLKSWLNYKLKQISFIICISLNIKHWRNWSNMVWLSHDLPIKGEVEALPMLSYRAGRWIHFWTKVCPIPLSHKCDLDLDYEKSCLEYVCYTISFRTIKPMCWYISGSRVLRITFRSLWPWTLTLIIKISCRDIVWLS